MLRYCNLIFSIFLISPKKYLEKNFVLNFQSFLFTNKIVIIQNLKKKTKPIHAKVP